MATTLLSLQETDALNSVDESYCEPMSMNMLEEICDGSQSHPNVKRRDARYKIRDCVKQKQSEWKEALKATRNMGKGLHKVFRTVVKRFLKISHLWVNLVQKFNSSFQNPETLLKLPNYHNT